MTCKECTGIQGCPMPRQGYVDDVRCRYNLRGYYNDNIILQERYKQFTCDNRDEIIKHINTKNSIYLYGKYGLGKSHFLKWAANKYNLQGKSIYYSLVAEINRKLRKEVQYSMSTGESIRSEVDKMKDIDVLLLDDIGNEKMTEFIAEAMQVVIDHRYTHKKPTFISSNYSINELFKVYEKSIGTVKAGQLARRIKVFGEIQIIGQNWGI